MKPILKILVIRFSSIGDIILTSPVVRCIRHKYPACEIHFLTKAQYQNLVAHNPYINKIHLLDKSPALKAIELKAEGFDYVIDLHNNLRTKVFKSVLSVDSNGFEKVNFEKWLAVNFKNIESLPTIHIVDRYVNTCKNIGVENDNEGLDFFINPNENVDFFLALQNEKYFAWAIGAQHFTKRYPTNKIIEVCKNLNIKIVLLGGKEDSIEAEKIEAACPENIINYCGKLSIHQSAIVLKAAKLLVSNDTGLMHMAAAFKKPIVSLWGNTITQFGMTPYYGKHEIKNTVFETLDLNCRPCSKIGFNTCPKKHFSCMNNISNDELTNCIKNYFITL